MTKADIQPYLVIAPHADDEVLGVGGTIAKLSRQGHRVVVAILTGHGDRSHPIWEKSTWDKVRKECRAAAKVLGVETLVFRELPASCLDVTPTWKINKVVAELINEFDPLEIYVPFAFDLHKDHGAIAYAASVASRPYLQVASRIQRVLAYETLSETHLSPPYMSPGFQPNVFIDISQTLETKLEAMLAYSSQLQNDTSPRSIRVLKALAVLRGSHIGTEAAEAFLLLGEYQR